MYRNHTETEFWINDTPVPLDRERVAALTKSEWARFSGKTEQSKDEMEQACEVIPLGVTSSFQHWDPYPGIFNYINIFLIDLFSLRFPFICHSVDRVWRRRIPDGC